MTATDAGRRRWLRAALSAGAGLGLGLGCGLVAATPGRRGEPRWAAAWNGPSGHQVGLLARAADGRWRVEASVAVPTRSHGLTALPDGSLLTIARRPGDWLLRWHPDRRHEQLVWNDAGSTFNGHAVLLPGGRQLLTSETDTELDQGRLVLRRLDTLEPLQRWATGGRDPHQLLVAEEGRSVWVANGGVASQPETGRARVADATLDSSIVRLDLRSGQPLGHWTLDDPWLSLRHLAWHAGSRTLGVALQAEHPQASRRPDAPVLALLDVAQDRLSCPQAPRAMAGYGGDICATPRGFAVSSPRAHRVAFWDHAGQPDGELQLPEACALSYSDAGLLVGVRQGGLRRPAEVPDSPGPTLAAADALPFSPDNHWIRWR
ncbi:hypothetical protein C7444_10727 [Sphaerotilus hippei]|uniref:DUF1513 domain-containing protein n=1 Tax=Sphaerotilus hippei TaxID=744406 RepID=A0A318H070_9BURK|nr:DUF1513 domain-containing protein [Sphaerotilus hippei]PXW96121.1 hypothetical protein C7444_10727 [Sphaerotilus hippei]